MNQEKTPAASPAVSVSLENLANSVRKFNESIPQMVQAVCSFAASAVGAITAAAEVYHAYRMEQEKGVSCQGLEHWLKQLMEPKYLIDYALEWAKIHRPGWVHQYKYAKKRRVRNKYKNRILRAYIGRS